MRLSTLLRTLVLGFAMVSLFACTQKAATTETEVPAQGMAATDTAQPAEPMDAPAAAEEQVAAEEAAPETN